MPFGQQTGQRQADLIFFSQNKVANSATPMSMGTVITFLVIISEAVSICFLLVGGCLI